MIKIEIVNVAYEDPKQLRALAQYFEAAAEAREAGFRDKDVEAPTVAIVDAMTAKEMEDLFNKTAKEAVLFEDLDNVMSKGLTEPGAVGGDCKTEFVSETIEITEPEKVKINTPPPPPQLVDSAGEVWDPKKHTRTKSRYVDGRWKPLRTNTPVLKEDKAPMTARGAEIPPTFEGVMGFVQSQVEQRKLKPEQVFHTVQQYGINSLIELRDHPDLMPSVLASLQAIVIGGE